MKPKQIIGKHITVDFPDLGIDGVNAKIDTGAYSNTLHCYDIIEADGKLSFKVLDPQHPVFSKKQHVFSSFSRKNIKNSSGAVENRYLVKTRVRIGGRLIKSIISLTNRGTMRYPVLIGRRLLKNKFIVDVSLK